MNMSKLEDPTTEESRLFKHPLVLNPKTKKYVTDSLVLIGYLYARHESDEKRLEALWGILNLACEEKVSKQRMMDTLSRLIDFAVQVRLDIETERGAHPSALEYLGKANSKRE